MRDEKNVPSSSWRAPCIDPEMDEWRFTKKALLWKLAPWYRVPEKKLAHLRQRLLTRFAMSAANEEECEEYFAAFDDSWPQMKEKFRKNPVLYQFMLEYGVHSEFFYPFLMRVPNATTLEVVGGNCYDMLGRLRKVPRTDALYPFIFGDEMFGWVGARMRGEQACLQKAEKVFFIGGGLLQALRYRDYRPLVPEQEIIACDVNADLRSELDRLYADPPAGMTIRYYFDSAEQMSRRPEYQAYFDMVDASGVFSYRNDLDDFRRMLRGALRMLRPNGILLFDLQILRKVLLFDKLILDWNTQPSMKPEKDVRAAIDLVGQLCSELGVTVEVTRKALVGIQFMIHMPYEAESYAKVRALCS